MKDIIEKGNSRIEEKRDRILCLFIASYYILSALNISIKVIFRVSGTMDSLMSNAVAAVLIVGFLVSFRTLVNRAGIPFLTSELLAAAAYLVSVVLGNAFSYLFLINKALWTMGICIPLGIAAYAVIDKRQLIRYLDISNCIIIVPLCVAMLTLNRNDQSYSMSCAYAVLMPAIMLFYHFFDSKKILYLIIGIAVTVIIAFFGNRGALICVLIYIMIKALLNNARPFIKAIYAAAIIVLLYFVFAKQDMLIRFIANTVNRFGIRSYTLNRIIHSSFYESESRNYLWELYMGRVLEKPLQGWGVGGGWISPEYYPHNIFIELLLSFGLIFGTLSILYYIFLHVRIFTCKDSLLRELLIIYAVCSLSLLISGSFLNTPKIFILALLCYRSKSAAAHHVSDEIAVS